MTGAIGNNAASLAQSKHAGVGAAGDGGCNTVVAEGSEVLVVLKNAEGRETARSRLCWQWLGCTSCDGVADSGWGVSTVVDNIVNDMAGV